MTATSPIVQDERNLWRQYRATGDKSIHDRLVKQYAPLVKYVAGKMAMSISSNVDFDDLVSYGVFGLFDAIQKYDPEKPTKFKTYAVTRIRGAIYDGLRSIDWVPRSIRQKAREVDNVIRDLEASLGRPCTNQEIADRMDVTLQELEKIKFKISGTSMLSLNDVWNTGDESDNIATIDNIESPASMNPDAIIEKEEIKKFIVAAIEELSDREKKVLVLYYYEDLTLKEIGKILEVTESRISQLHTKAIRRLREKVHNIKKGLL